MKQKILPVILGLGVAFGGLLGCQSTLSTSTTPPWIVPEPVPATTIQVFLTASATTSATLDGAKVLLLSGTIRKDSVIVSGVTTDTTTVAFTNLQQGTYTVYVAKTGYTKQSTLVDLSGTEIPVAGFLLKRLVTTSTVNVGTPVAVVVNTPTVATVPPPSSVTSAVDNTAQASVTIDASTTLTGEVSVVSQSGVETPLITSAAGAVTGTVLSAVEIQTGSDASSDSVQISLPVPIDLADAAAAAGSKVNLMVFDPVALTWKSAGLATIGADGLAVADNKINLTGSSTLVAIAAEPKTTTLSESSTTQTALTPDAITDLLQRGETTYEYDQNPSVQAETAKLGRSMSVSKLAYRDPPAGMDEYLWALVAPAIGQIEPSLKAWLNGATSKAKVTLPVTKAEIKNEVKTRTFNVEYDLGGGVKKVYKVTLQYTKTQVIEIIHTSGSGTAG